MYVDQAMRINYLNVSTGEVTNIDKGKSMLEGGLRSFSVTWSPDSNWIAYSRATDNPATAAIFLYDSKNNKVSQLTSGYYKDYAPAFSVDGNHLFFATNRTFNPVYSDLDNTFVYPNATNIAVGTLNKSEKSLLEIKNDFPKASIHRRNTGYALDELLNTSVFSNSEEKINIAKLLCGSEGTLAFTTEITLQLDDLPPTESILVAAHFNSIQESLEAVVVAMQHNLYMCELMDKTILDCTKNNREQTKNRFFVEGDPKAILMLEIKSNDLTETQKLADALISDLKKYHFGYAFPKLIGNDIIKAINLRKAGLGLLGNIIGDKKAVACIEDTAVELKDLPNYISEFTKMMEKYGQDAVYYAHAGAGELHLRPILNLKKNEDVVLFRTITTEVAKLVKKYKGSFSGEHGDGIVRAEFIEFMIGSKNYELLKRIKSTFDSM